MGTTELTVDLRGNRLAYDNSVIAYDDGAFYDHNGSRYYSSIEALREERPELVRIGSEPYTPPKHSGTGTNHDFKAVTAEVVEMKGRGISKKTVLVYLPFADKEKLWGSIGTTKKGYLSAFFFTPSLHGAKRGEHYNFAQYRTPDGWMSVHGSDGKAVECMALHPGPVYCTFGMGDFLLLKSTGLNYLCFGGDGSAKNSPYSQYIVKKAQGRIIRLVADNDPSGGRTADYLRDMGLRVVTYDWKQMKRAKEKMDLRDIAWMVKNMGGDMDDFTRYLEEVAIWHD